MRRTKPNPARSLVGLVEHPVSSARECERLKRRKESEINLRSHMFSSEKCCPSSIFLNPPPITRYLDWLGWNKKNPPHTLMLSETRVSREDGASFKENNKFCRCFIRFLFLFARESAQNDGMMDHCASVFFARNAQAEQAVFHLCVCCFSFCFPGTFPVSQRQAK